MATLNKISFEFIANPKKEIILGPSIYRQPVLSLEPFPIPPEKISVNQHLIIG
jgi:hypothetical protein